MTIQHDHPAGLLCSSPPLSQTAHRCSPSPWDLAMLPLLGLTNSISTLCRGFPLRSACGGDIRHGCNRNPTVNPTPRPNPDLNHNPVTELSGRVYEYEKRKVLCTELMSVSVSVWVSVRARVGGKVRVRVRVRIKVSSFLGGPASLALSLFFSPLSF